ncbi:S-layer homology domain-containing protein [Kocuria dechangensis]|uniref:S-layer homology domain-containing protein n=1 Tax=Kocuria dechangensis TaxID=1176249 RepID=UPI001E4B26BB|nr:S-layer homology domain-containing protein [Kocuria dechangensis]
MSLLSQIGVVKGYPDNTFRPDEKVTREATAAFLYRLAGSSAYTAPPTSRFSDVKPGAPFYKEISWMAEQGFATGWPDRSFRP